MRYQIEHTTTYDYAEPVELLPHILRLRPRSDGTQQLLSFDLAIAPQPIGRSEIVDLDGNATIQVWFSGAIAQLQVVTRSQVETKRESPFAYILEGWATHLPMEYPIPMLTQLQPYFQPYGSSVPLDSVTVELAQEILYESDRHVVSFLSLLNQRIYRECAQVVRETGVPLPPAITWKQKRGSCRDFTVLFMEACRAVGLAARFTSGYQEGDRQAAIYHLHAWAEVYLPGAGWRGYDPTQGLAVADRHIALVSSPLAVHAAPIAGKLRGGSVRSQISYQLQIQHLS